MKKDFYWHVEPLLQSVYELMIALGLTGVISTVFFNCDNWRETWLIVLAFQIILKLNRLERDNNE